MTATFRSSNQSDFRTFFGKLYEYKGNYETYVMEKAERERVAVEQEEKRKRLFKQELAWMRAGVRTRNETTSKN